MKINCGRSRLERSMAHQTVVRKQAEEAQKWQVCFAWLPTRVAKGDCRWLESIECRYRHVKVIFDYSRGLNPWKFWCWEYHSIEYRPCQ